jgi:hypothetical protein
MLEIHMPKSHQLRIPADCLKHQHFRLVCTGVSDIRDMPSHLTDGPARSETNFYHMVSLSQVDRRDRQSVMLTIS